MSENEKNTRQDTELKLSDLVQVSGGAGGAAQSAAACPQCGRHTLTVDWGRNTTVCTSCGYENKRLCVNCGSLNYYYDQSDHHQYCHDCGWA